MGRHKKNTIGVGQLTATNLKQTLWETLNEVRGGAMDAADANAVSANARTIVSIARIEFDNFKLAKSGGNKPKQISFMA